MKNLLKDWGLSASLTFLMYEMFWGFGMSDVEECQFSWDEVGFDFLYCTIFALTSIIITKLLSKVEFFRRLTVASQSLFCVTVLLLNMLVAVGFEKIYNFILPAPDSVLFWMSVYMFCFISTLLTLVHTTFHYCKMAISQRDKMSMLQKKNLKRQLDPHFVFNSLSALAELTRQNPEQAERYVIKLSKVYRYILSHIEQDYASLAESLRFISDYVSLQEIRLSGRVNLVVEDFLVADSDFILPMSLQLLVENAIKHNPPDTGEVLAIRILRIGDWIVVSNSTNNYVSAESFGLGLDCSGSNAVLRESPSQS